MSDSDTQVLRRRLGQLEAEHARLCAELSKSGAGETTLPGLFLEVEARGATGLVPAARVAEVARLVACRPIAGAPRHVLGAFLYRGAQAVAVDLARLLGGEEEPQLDARMVMFEGSRPVGLVVERVRSLVRDPAVAQWSQLGGASGHWRGTGFVAGLCRSGATLAPLLDVDRVLDGVDSLARQAE